jgi:hypothetical protein
MYAPKILSGIFVKYKFIAFCSISADETPQLAQLSI